MLFYAYNTGRKFVHSVMKSIGQTPHESLKESLPSHALLSPFFGLSFVTPFCTFSSASGYFI